MPDRAVQVVGLVVDSIREWFDPAQRYPPLGGGTELVHVLAGETVVPPPWVGVGEDEDVDCSDCGAYLWVRLAARWRTGGSSPGHTAMFPDELAAAGCGSSRAITVEAGIARCHPLDPDPEELYQLALTQMDDGWRIDNALCRAMKRATADGVEVATDTAIGRGEPYGPQGLVVAWTQQAHAKLDGR